jgi:hypothetical protein
MKTTTSLNALLAAALTLGSASALAVPAFARQTGMACSQCHTVFPELTPMGRNFKAGGYTQTMTKQISEGDGEEKRLSLEFPANVPLGVMAIAGFTHTAVAQVGPDGTAAKNDDLSLPQQFSLFYAGKIAPKLGAFIQLTYDAPSDHLGFDNTDIRFAHTTSLAGSPLILGATLNNGPTVSDLWNSTPAWGVPFIASGSAPSPSAGTLVEGRMAGQVAGVGLYGFWKGMVYAEFDVYRSAPLGVSLPLHAATGATNVIQNAMPYWRVAVEKGFGTNQTLSVGTFGLYGELLPGGTYTDNSSGTPVQAVHALVGPGDRYLDLAVDAQYQYIGDKHIVTVVATYINERQDLVASNGFGNADNLVNDLHTFKASGSYIFDRLIGARGTFSTVRGSGDATLYGGQGPRATTLTAELFYTPWQNVKVGLSYTSYLEFNSGVTNYDGNGRNAADNNTLYAYTWLAF